MTWIPVASVTPAHLRDLGSESLYIDHGTGKLRLVGQVDGVWVSVETEGFQVTWIDPEAPPSGTGSVIADYAFDVDPATAFRRSAEVVRPGDLVHGRDGLFIYALSHSERRLVRVGSLSSANPESCYREWRLMWTDGAGRSEELFARKPEQ